MTHLIALLSLVICSLNFSSESITDATNSSILWESDQKLVWNDFQASPDRFSQFAALTRWKIGYDFEYKGGRGILNVKASFIKSKSWVKSNSKKPNILAHEQLHFDIAELHARKLRKEWSTYIVNFKTLQRDVDKMFNDTWDDTVAMQEKYDKETDHGTIEKKQAHWAAYVEEEMDKLSAFAQ